MISVPDRGVPKLVPLINMAANMGSWQHVFIEILLTAGATKHQCARQANCSTKSIQSIQRNLRLHRKTKLDRKYKLRRLLSNEAIVTLLCRLNDAPNMYLDEMTWFIYDQFQIVVSRQALSAELRVVGWSRKLVRKLLLYA